MSFPVCDVLFSLILWPAGWQVYLQNRLVTNQISDSTLHDTARWVDTDSK